MSKLKPRKGFTEVRPGDLCVGDVIYVADEAGDFVLKSNTFRVDHLEGDGFMVYVGYDPVKETVKKYIDLGGLYVFRKDVVGIE